MGKDGYRRRCCPWILRGTGIGLCQKIVWRYNAPECGETMVQDCRCKGCFWSCEAGGSVYRERHLDLRYPPIGKGMAASEVQGS